MLVVPWIDVRPVVEHLIREGSVLGGVTPEVVQAALDVAPELAELLDPGQSRGRLRHGSPNMTNQ